MRNPNHRVDHYRVNADLYPERAGDPSGVFLIDFHGIRLRVTSSGPDEECGWEQWEHVSVSTIDRWPTWLEMCFVKNIFWSVEETVLQFHPPEIGFRSLRPFRLHLWRPTGMNILMPLAKYA